MSIEKFLRTPIKMEQLIQLPKDEIDMYVLYTKPNIENINKDTPLYLDEGIEVDDDDNEIYPLFAEENGLLYYFNGDIAVDIILSTREQFEEKGKTPSIDDYIQNFNYYSNNDCFFDFG